MLFHDCPDNCQPQTAAASFSGARLIDPVETIKYMGQQLSS